jgi:hypothetical protein
MRLKLHTVELSLAFIYSRFKPARKAPRHGRDLSELGLRKAKAVSEARGFASQSQRALAVSVAGTSAVGDGAQAALPRWGLGADEVEGFNEGAWRARTDGLKQGWADQG